MSTVRVCSICDIADCAHIREPRLKSYIADLKQQITELEARIHKAKQVAIRYPADTQAMVRRLNGQDT